MKNVTDTKLARCLNTLDLTALGKIWILTQEQISCVFDDNN